MQGIDSKYRFGFDYRQQASNVVTINIRGLPAPKEIPQLPPNMHVLHPPRLMDLVVVAVAGPVWELFDLGNNRAPRSEYRPVP